MFQLQTTKIGDLNQNERVRKRLIEGHGFLYLKWQILLLQSAAVEITALSNPEQTHDFKGIVNSYWDTSGHACAHYLGSKVASCAMHLLRI